MLTKEEVPTPAVTQPLEDVLTHATRTRARKRGPELGTQLATTAAVNLKSKHKTNLFSPKQVAEILQKVHIGLDLSPDQRTAAQSVIQEFADVFALNLSKVCAVNFLKLCLDILAAAVFPMRAGQRQMTELQKQALYRMLDKLEAAGVIKQVMQDQVKAVSPISLVPKPGGINLPTTEYLQHLANLECQCYVS
ncbi:hypothetical protein RhiTH_010922 [Rhizoctonia solani]